MKACLRSLGFSVTMESVYAVLGDFFVCNCLHDACFIDPVVLCVFLLPVTLF
jgi:hypothetical protein